MSKSEHHHYLADGIHSSSLEFLESLVNLLGKKGTVLVYNKAFEKTRLKELMNEHPQYQKKVEALLDRVVDLMDPFRKRYRLPEMKDSRSIKYVFPALVHELRYDDLSINNETDASDAFYNLKRETDVEKVKVTREALLEYCELDTGDGETVGKTIKYLISIY